MWSFLRSIGEAAKERRRRRLRENRLHHTEVFHVYLPNGEALKQFESEMRAKFSAPLMPIQRPSGGRAHV